MKKLISITLALMLVFSTVAVGYATPKWGMPPGQDKKIQESMFNDLEDNWAESIINILAGDGRLKGYGNGKFMPNKPVTKLESLVMLYETVEGYEEEAPDGDFDQDEYGLYKGPEWGQDYYAWAFEKGAFEETQKSFNANAAITRAEFAFYAFKLGLDEGDFEWEDYESYSKGYKDSDDIDEEYAEGVGAMNRLRYMIGNDENMFHGGGSLKRSEAAMVMYRMIYLGNGKVSDPWAEIYVYEEDGCITRLDPEITITFSESVYKNVAGDDDFEVEDVIVFEMYDDDEWEDIDFSRTDKEFDGGKEIWIIEPDKELLIDTEYRIKLENDDFYDADGNNLRKDVVKTFETCESYDMTADYEAELEFHEEDSEDWLDFTIDVDANDKKGTEVKLVFVLPDGVSVQYEDGSWKDLTNDDVYDEGGFGLSDGIVDYFRVSFASPGAYVIPVEFTPTEVNEDVRFTIYMKMGRVALDEESNGEAGNGVIYRLEDETAYRVTEIDGEKETVYYTTSDGALVDDIEDMEPLGEDVEMITGLDNDKEYLVEIPLSLEIHDVTESAAEGWDFEFELTSIPNDDHDKSVEAYHMLEEDMDILFEDDDDAMLDRKPGSEWIRVESVLGPWDLQDEDEPATMQFRIFLGEDRNEGTYTVEFWTSDHELMLGKAEYEFEIE